MRGQLHRVRQISLKVFDEISNRIDQRLFFDLAFEQVQKTVQTIGVENRIVIIFMTDGCDTCNNPAAITQAQTKLRLFLRNATSNCVVHAIGYSRDHDLNMLNTLTSLGTTEGVYRYAEGSTGLDEKFNELFEFADSTVELTLKVPNVQQAMKLTGEIVDAEYLEAECWLSIPPQLQDTLQVTVGTEQFHLVPEYVERDTIFTLKSLSKRANDISTQEELDRIQKELQEIKMFGGAFGGSRVDRQIAMDLRAELQTRLDALHAVMADIARGTLNQTAALAKMNDLRYADK